MRYTFSKETVAEFYGRKFYSITNSDDELCAYSEKVFEVPNEVALYSESKTLIFEKAVLISGEIWGGVIRGGVIRGGVIRGGVIWGGVIWGGVIWGGEIEVSLLQIQGTRHFCYASPTSYGKEIHLGIGCHFYSIQDWLANYKLIGGKEGYTDNEIEEYGGYIELFAKRYAPDTLKKKRVKKTAI